MSAKRILRICGIIAAILALPWFASCGARDCRDRIVALYPINPSALLTKIGEQRYVWAEGIADDGKRHSVRKKDDHSFDLLGFRGGNALISKYPLILTSSDPHVASVDDCGVVTARGTGHAQIAMRYGELRTHMDVTVEASLETQNDDNR